MPLRAELSSPEVCSCVVDDKALCSTRSESTRHCPVCKWSLHVMLWSNEAAREDSMPLHSWPAHCNVNLWLLPLQACFADFTAL